MKRPFLSLVLLISFLLTTAVPYAQESDNDWPTFRHDSQRTAYTPAPLPEELQISWIRKLPANHVAWQDTKRIQFDRYYYPIVKDKILYLTSSGNDCLYAFQTENGEELWRYYANASIRFAPLAYKDKLYIVSDDGLLSCLDAKKGNLLWQHDGAPNQNKNLAHGRLASVFPARGAPAIYDDTLYYAAGIWSFLGCFVYALNPENGELIWEDSGAGSLFVTQGHDTPAFGGIAPQGYLSVNENMLIVPNGRSMPASYNRKTREFLKLNHTSRRSGYFAPLLNDIFFSHNALIKAASVETAASVGSQVIFKDQFIFANQLDVYDSTQKTEISKNAPKYKEYNPYKKVFNQSLSAELKFIAGNTLYGIQSKTIVRYDISRATLEEPSIKELKALELENTLVDIIAADQKLFAVTDENEIICFAQTSNSKEIKKHSFATKPFTPAKEVDLKALGIHADTIGYTILLPHTEKSFAETIVAKSKMQVIQLAEITKDGTLAQERKKWDSHGLYGNRVDIIEMEDYTQQLPPYIATKIIGDLTQKTSENVATILSALYKSIRPYGGQAFLKVSEAKASLDACTALNLPKAKMEIKSEWLVVTREGALPNTAPWTHQYGDATNDVISKDGTVKAPLGLLWFGGTYSNQLNLTKHGHAPSPEVAGGRLITQGPNSIQAADIYTGMPLWSIELPEVSKNYDTTNHQPGANAIGSNYVSLEDLIYVVYKDKCLVFDAATGQKKFETEMPPLANKDKPAPWGFIAVSGDYLIGSAEPLSTADKIQPGAFTWNGTTSKAVAVFNRLNGKLIWKQEARFGFRHNTIIAGDNTLFCIDLVPKNFQQFFQDNQKEDIGKIKAFNLATGELFWETDEAVFGTWLGYSSEKKILLQGSRPSRDMLKDEPKNRMNAYESKTGKLLWDFSHSYSGPCMLIGDEIIAQGNGFNLLTGEPKMKIDFITGAKTRWQFSRTYGCNVAMGSKNLIMFRSAAAGYYDLLEDSGTGNFGSFRSSCTNNLIIADGIISVPDYTRGCTCSYPNQTSLALYHQPDIETWTFQKNSWSRRLVKHLGINLGAPGNFCTKEGDLWVPYPTSSKGFFQELPIKLSSSKVEYFRQHIIKMPEGKYKQIGSNGAKGLKKIEIPTGSKDKEVNYTVVLYFNEPNKIEEGQRIMNIKMQKQTVKEGLDIIKETKAVNRVLRIEFNDIKATDYVVIEFDMNEKSTVKESIVSGIELILKEEEKAK